MTFSVSKAVEKMEKVFNGGAEAVKTHTPFATIIKIDDFEKLKNEELEKKGYGIPPFHPSCRGRIVRTA
jgi:hypothetical protein